MSIPRNLHLSIAILIILALILGKYNPLSFPTGLLTLYTGPRTVKTQPVVPSLSCY